MINWIFYKRKKYASDRGRKSNETYWKKFKKKINKFLENLAEVDKKTFGCGKLDCCQLHKNDQNINIVK